VFYKIIICAISLFIPALADFDFSPFRVQGISVIVAVFSGRPDPVFTIRDSTDIETIIAKLSPFTLDSIDSSIYLKPDSACQTIFLSQLGYVGLSLQSDSLPYILFEVGNQAVSFALDTTSTGKRLCRYVRDGNSSLEKLLIAILSKDSSFIDDSKFPFSEIPDSLKPNVSTKSNIVHNNAVHLAVRYSMSGITARWRPFNGTASFALFNVQGKVLAIYDVNGNMGTAIINHRCFQLSTGLYLIRSNLSEKFIPFMFFK
jgi:hypothetical protein